MEHERAPTKDEQAGMDWWNRISENLRAKWLTVLHSGRAVDAWEAYKQSAAPVDLLVQTQAEEARLYREGINQVGTGGVVVFFNGELQGWVNELRDPQQWMAGCIAIDEAGRRWQTIAGDNYNGALTWLRIDAEA